ncbi:2OG-Fe(II) oxygenase [Dokdonella sp. MW10]|uniref:2OG-Fe(II) oxygenase n=1 Tax=Dokdonella sp. MW10 TaxID=2992926 RepID=UPI003F7D36D8
MADDFIEVYERAVDPAVCRALIQRFNASGKAVRGSTGGGVDTRLKDSWDITIDDHPEWRDAVNALNTAMMGALMRYVRKYPYVALAPLSLRMPDPKTGELAMLDPDSLRALPDNLLQHLLVKCFRPGTINLQKYIANQGGYPYWHCELYPKMGDTHGETLHRVVLWSVYLNDGFAEGETEFVHQQRKVVPDTGSLVIAPAGYTHTHRGNMPKGGDKYIATSWVLFQRPEVLFGTPQQQAANKR